MKDVGRERVHIWATYVFMYNTAEHGVKMKAGGNNENNWR